MPVRGRCSQCGTYTDLIMDFNSELEELRCPVCHEEMQLFYRQKSRDDQIFWILVAIVVGILICVFYWCEFLLPKG